MNPLVSIIMPCYNAERYIAQSIESVLAQTYTNWELLITDDCSTDNSVKISSKVIAFRMTGLTFWFLTSIKVLQWQEICLSLVLKVDLWHFWIVMMYG